MPYIKKVNDIALGNSNTFFNKIKSEIVNLIKASETEFYELELFSVQDILLDTEVLPNNDYKYYGLINYLYWFYRD